MLQAATLRELRQVLAELELVSHVSAARPGGSSGRDQSESIGGKRPPGGIDRKDDRERGHAMKSPEHFRRRIAKAHSEKAFEAILADARASLEAHRRQPPPSDRPELSSAFWPRWASESDLPAREVARLSGCSRSYVEKIRKRYGERGC